MEYRRSMGFPILACMEFASVVARRQSPRLLSEVSLSMSWKRVSLPAVGRRGKKTHQLHHQSRELQASQHIWTACNETRPRPLGPSMRSVGNPSPGEKQCTPLSKTFKSQRALQPPRSLVGILMGEAAGNICSVMDVQWYRDKEQITCKLV